MQHLANSCVCLLKFRPGLLTLKQPANRTRPEQTILTLPQEKLDCQRVAPSFSLQDSSTLLLQSGIVEVAPLVNEPVLKPDKELLSPCGIHGNVFFNMQILFDDELEELLRREGGR